MLRYMGFMEIDDNEWQSIFSDLENLLKIIHSIIF